MANSPSIGQLGEQLVAQWLRQQGWSAIIQGWRSRWGELDLVAHWSPPDQPGSVTQITFVEVKTRRAGNWDSDGLLAITPQKQAKLWTTAQLYLADYPSGALLPCRFDVALVAHRARPRVQGGGQVDLNGNHPFDAPVVLGRWMGLGAREFCLHTYLEGAFDGGGE
jgi:putative endonuclease